MENKNQTPFRKTNQGKITKKSESQKIYEFLFKQPANSKMIHIALGIPRENITRRKRKLEDRNSLWVVYHDYCPYTNRLTQFLTTNPETLKKWQSK